MENAKVDMMMKLGHKMEQPFVIFKCLFRKIAHMFYRFDPSNALCIAL